MWHITIGILIVTFTIYYFNSRRRRQKEIKRLTQVVEQRRKERDDKIAKLADKLGNSDEYRRISLLCLDDLIDALQSERLTAQEVLKAYQYQAILAHKKTNCITTFIDEAESWAENLDQLTKDPNYVKPPFFGVPFSIKECTKVKGYDQTRGYAHCVGKIAQEDAVIVQQVKQLGGIPFVLTNVPQSLLSFSCSNPIYGRTLNPYNPERTCGGSSGGEAAIIAEYGSIIGIGGDVGGSIRIPCHYSGIAGFKPSHRRISSRGVVTSTPGRPLINAAVGPMSRNINDCSKFLSHLWSEKYFSKCDNYVAPVFWNESLYAERKPLRIGYYVDDGWFTPTPSNIRAVRETRDYLERIGHTLVEFQPPNIPEALSLILGAITVDGGKYLLENFNKDLINDEFREEIFMLRIPIYVMRLFAFVLDGIYPRIARLLRSFPYDCGELRRIYEEIEIYRYKFTDLLQKNQFDAVLCPVQALVAVEHSLPLKLVAAVSYTAIFNQLDFAAGTVNVTTVNEKDELELEAYPETDPIYKIAKNASKNSLNLPVGVQIAVPPYREEIALRILGEIQNMVNQNR